MMGPRGGGETGWGTGAEPVSEPPSSFLVMAAPICSRAPSLSRPRPSAPGTSAHRATYSAPSRLMTTVNFLFIVEYARSRLTFAVRQGGPSASSTPQNGEPALACTAFVSRRDHDACGG